MWFLPAPPRSAAGRILLSLAIGLGLPVLLFGILLLRTQGYEPMGLCMPTVGGILPIDMSRGGALPYTCALNWRFVATSMLLPGLGFALLAWLLLGLQQQAEGRG
ncbi:hypothetical protein [Ferrovibrio sp.]|uniref:hypothetical protein n=1 Tax=Ferrovibrio sp. TaxID=1917215 RepID=UPI003512D17A